MAQQVWRGSISFGLVNVAVRAFGATRDQKVHFHQIDTRSNSRIGYDKVSKATGEKVDKADIALGYEVEPGSYVTFDPEEVAALRPRSTRTVEISDFVDLAAIDPIYYEKTYWLVPADEAAEKAYGLLAAAMESEQRVGIGMVVMRTKQYLAAIRPLQGALAMSTMRFADEVVSAEDVGGMPDRVEPSDKELELARQIITSLADDWDPSAYHDSFTAELRSLIAEKAAGSQLKVDTEGAPEETGQLVDLMAALQASVDAAKRPRGDGADAGDEDVEDRSA
jgi:DNA end-binding protein Ku